MIRAEIRDTLRLAGPVIATQLGAISMNIMDTIMVGRVGNAALSAVALGGMLSITVLLAAMGILMSLDTVVSQAFGAGRLRDCGRAMRHGVLLAVLLSVPVMLLLSQSRRLLMLVGEPPALVDGATRFVLALNGGMLPFLVFTALRQFLQGIGRAKPAMTIVVLASLLNFVGNWVLIYGHLGAPALGATGAAWSTTISRWAMCLALGAYVLRNPDLRVFGVRERLSQPDRGLLLRLLRLGGPVGMQYAMEVGVFAAGTMMMGWFGTLPLAGHQIALNLVSTTFMVPLGFSATAAVRVGQALGRGDVPGARRAALIAYALGLGFMALSALCFGLFPEVFARIYTDKIETIQMGASLLVVGAAFQISDGGQTIGIGALRGAADTRVPMLVALVAYWLVGLPMSYLLAFRLGVGPRGIWWGETIGLTLVAVSLAVRFYHRVRQEQLELLQVG